MPTIDARQVRVFGALRGRAARGFSFVEMTLSVVILSYLVLLAVPMAENGERRARELETRQAQREIRAALDGSDYAALFARPAGSTWEVVHGEVDHR